jgi:prefoldin subunit 5
MRQLAKCREHFACVRYREKIEHLTADLEEVRTKLERFELRVAQHSDQTDQRAQQQTKRPPRLRC